MPDFTEKKNDKENEEASVRYIPAEEDAYIEVEGSWFAEQGAKCALQYTGARQVATYGHLHEALELIYIKSGEFTAFIGDGRYEVTAGDLLFFRPSEIHRIYAGDTSQNSYYVIKIHPSLVFDVADKKNGASYMLRFAIGTKNAKRVWKNTELAATRVEKTVVEMERECRERRPYFDIAVREKAASLVLFLLRSEQGEDTGGYNAADREERFAVETVYKALTYINSHSGEDISAADVSRAVAMSYSHFSRSFGRIVGQNFKEYLSGVRLKRAEEMLLTTEKSVAEIAKECGYKSTSYFIMSFKKAKGTTPHAYKKQMSGA